MPNSAPHPCTYSGCRNLVRNGPRCPDHPLQVIRSAEIQNMYSTKYWHDRRRACLTQQPWCVECLREGVYTQAMIADHVTPHRGDVHSFRTGELQSLCETHHNSKTAREMNREI